MTCHFNPDRAAEATPAASVSAPPRRRLAGQRAYHSGLGAEQAVERAYRRRGARVLARRWRGRGGEIDLILDDHGVTVFCEVKRAVSSDGARASLRPAQASRIHAAAAEFAECLPAGLLSEMRFDLAWANEGGRGAILPGAFSHF